MDRCVKKLANKIYKHWRELLSPYSYGTMIKSTAKTDSMDYVIDG